MDGLGRLLHDLERGSVAVRRGVCGVGKLLGDKDLRVLLRHALGYGAALRDGVAYVARVMDEYHLGAVVPHELAPLLADAVGHDDHRLVALHRSYEGEANSLVAARRLHDYGIRPEKPARLGVAYHVVGGARLDGAADVQRLELDEHLGHVGRRHAVEPHERRMPHRIKNSVADHGVPPSFFPFSPEASFCIPFSMRSIVRFISGESGSAARARLAYGIAPLKSPWRRWH